MLKIPYCSSLFLVLWKLMARQAWIASFNAIRPVSGWVVWLEKDAASKKALFFIPNGLKSVIIRNEFPALNFIIPRIRGHHQYFPHEGKQNSLFLSRNSSCPPLRPATPPSKSGRNPICPLVSPESYRPKMAVWSAYPVPVAWPLWSCPADGVQTDCTAREVKRSSVGELILWRTNNTLQINSLNKVLLRPASN